MSEVLLWFAGTSLGALAGTALMWFGMRSAIQRDIMTALSMKFVYECDRCQYRRDNYTTWRALNRDVRRHEKSHPPREPDANEEYFHPMYISTNSLRIHGR